MTSLGAEWATPQGCCQLGLKPPSPLTTSCGFHSTLTASQLCPSLLSAQGKKETFHRPNDSKITNSEPRELFPSALTTPPSPFPPFPRPEGTWETYSFKLNYFLEDRTELNWVNSYICCAQRFLCNSISHRLGCWALCRQPHQLGTPYWWPFLGRLDPEGGRSPSRLQKGSGGCHLPVPSQPAPVCRGGVSDHGASYR